ncbi:sporulation protein YqfD [Sutcliffiella sp. NC1]|uniref:sporulation protein YqfD n=1 Tax=Sutcliffiella sp. NC1 TaxID=3004096 RepID=UPI0022DE1716|nr:sporulation protein YqfD [Sutcliffiella sp. NC1]WBL13858.1 sporulation protein YqfD [Sutcliffiella sp. NC1]
MKNDWIHFFSGTVKIIIEGKGVERFINDCIRANISIWNIKKLGIENYTCYIRLKDVSSLRRIIKKHDCRFRFLTRKGLPFLVQYSWKNSGIIAGIAAFFITIFLLSNMVWSIQINGANPETEHHIAQELNKLGVKKGKFQFFLLDPESIQRHLTDTIEELTWIGVELNGTSYSFEVVEKTEPGEEEYVSPQNLVAKKKAVITDMFVEKGQPVVSRDDYVKEGQLLVSGLIGREEEQKAIAAKGKVYGEVWYMSTVTVPLKETLHVLTGENEKQHYVKVGKLSLPVWGFFKPEYEEMKEEQSERYLYFWKWKLPISYVQKSQYETELIQTIYSEEEAIEKGLSLGKEELENKLPQDAVIKGEKVLHQSLENGKVKLAIHYQVIENIVKTEPIIQGD